MTSGPSGRFVPGPDHAKERVVRYANIAWLSILAAVSATPGRAQDFTCRFRGNAEALARRLSPLDSIQVTLDGHTVRLCYGRPSARERQVMGGLVPYGEPWRLGANEPTTIHLPFAAEVAGVRVEPGTYTLYAVPAETEWQIVVNRGVQRWGIPISDAVRRDDVGAGKVPVERLEQPVETLTLQFTPPAGRETSLVIEWERARVRVPIRPAP